MSEMRTVLRSHCHGPLSFDPVLPKSFLAGAETRHTKSQTRERPLLDLSTTRTSCR
jgi:hypothetical protein